MINISTIDTLKAMHCGAMATELENQLIDPKTYTSLGFEERIALIVDAEWSRRQQNKLQKHIKQAGFSLASACIEGINTFLTENWTSLKSCGLRPANL